MQLQLHKSSYIYVTFVQKPMLKKYQKSMVVDKLTTPHGEESMFFYPS